MLRLELLHAFNRQRGRAIGQDHCWPITSVGEEQSDQDKHGSDDSG